MNPTPNTTDIEIELNGSPFTIPCQGSNCQDMLEAAELLNQRLESAKHAFPAKHRNLIVAFNLALELVRLKELSMAQLNEIESDITRLCQP